MKKIKFASSTILLMFIALLTLPSMITQANASYYSTNYNPYFVDSSHWIPDTWTASRSWHTYTIADGVAYTRAAIWGSVYEWGNTEYEQGTDPWGNYDNLMYNPPLTFNQQLVVTSKITEQHVDFWVGQANAYVEFWVYFTEPVGNQGFQWAELQVYLKSKSGLFNPCPARQNGYAVRTASNWYHVMYRTNDVGSSFTTRTVSLQGLISRLQSTWNVDLTKGSVTCICFGVEAVKGEMTAIFDTVNYQVGM